jgi:hypothetical protein
MDDRTKQRETLVPSRETLRNNGGGSPNYDEELLTNSGVANDFDLPQFLTTSEAARYCRFRSNAGLRKAWYRGDVFPTSRRGGKGTLLWHVDEWRGSLAGSRTRTNMLWHSGC